MTQCCFWRGCDTLQQWQFVLLLIVTTLQCRPCAGSLLDYFWQSSSGSASASDGVEDSGTSCAATSPLSVRLLSPAPRVYLLENFLSVSEVGHLKKLAAERGIFQAAAGSSAGKTRNTAGYRQEYLGHGLYASDPLVRGVEDRITELAHVPRDEEMRPSLAVATQNATGGPPGLVDIHHDHNAAALPLQPAARQGANPPLTELQSTVLAYLADVEAGGELVFPCVCDRSAGDGRCARVQKACKQLYEGGILYVSGTSGHHPSFKRESPPPKLAKQLDKAARVLRAAALDLCVGTSSAPGIRIKPRLGTAVFFFSNGVRNEADPRAWHGACNVTAGLKVTMQRFLFAPQGEDEVGEHASADFKW